jgi:hypothetical protein
MNERVKKVGAQKKREERDVLGIDKGALRCEDDK